MLTDQEKSFIEACFIENISSIQMCCKYGVDFRIENNWAISIAAENNKVKLLRWLFDKGITHQEASEKLVLAYMCHFENIDMVKYLIKNSIAYKTDQSAFSWTAATGNLTIGELLLGYLDDECLSGAFARASEKGNINFLDFMIANGIEKIDQTSKRAGYWALQKKHWKTVEYLIEMDLFNTNQINKYQEDYVKWKQKN